MKRLSWKYQEEKKALFEIFKPLSLNLYPHAETASSFKPHFHILSTLLVNAVESEMGFSIWSPGNWDLILTICEIGELEKAAEKLAALCLVKAILNDLLLQW